MNTNQPRTPSNNPGAGQYASQNRDESSVELTPGPVLKICKNCGDKIEHLADFPGPLCLKCYRNSDDAKQAFEAEDIRAMWGMKRNRRSV
jgi:hypothetical protein